MGDLNIGSVVTVVDENDAMKKQVGVVVFYDKNRNKILVRFGGTQQLYYTLEQLQEYK